MRMSVLAAALGVAAVAAGGGYYAIEVYPHQRFRTALDQAIASLPPGYTATYRDAHYTVASHEATISGLTFHAAGVGEPPVPLDVTVESYTLSNPNLDFTGAWNAAKANPAALARDAALPLADAIAVKGLTVHGPQFDMTLATLAMDKPRLYPWALLHDGVPGFQQVAAAMRPRTPPATPEDLLPLLRFEAAAMLGAAYDSYRAGDMKFALRAPGADANYEIRTMTGAMDRGILQRGGAEGIVFKGGNVGEVTFDRLSMDRIDVRDAALRLIGGETPSLSMLDGVKIGRIDYDGIGIVAPGKPPMHAGGMWLGPVSFAGGMPVAGTIGFREIRVEKSALPDAASQAKLAAFGLDAVTVSFALAYDWDVAKGTATIHDTTLKVDELGTLALTADLTNLAPGVAAMAQARLAHATLRYDDASLVDRALKATAADAGTDPETLRGQVEDAVRQQARAANPVLAPAGEAVAAFLAAPKSLTVELAPSSPVPMIMLRGGAATMNAMLPMLGLTVTANAP